MKKILFGLCLLCLPLALRAQAASVTVAWTLSTTPGIANQTVSYGVASATYTNNIVVGPAVTSLQLTNLAYSTTYFVAVKCADSKGQASSFSNEIAWTSGNPPPPAPPTGLKVLSVP